MSSKFLNESNESNEPGIIVESDLFNSADSARFALGIFSSSRMLSYEDGSVEQAIFRLRSKVYIDQEGYLDDSTKNEDGTEIDVDDRRSKQVFVVENRGPQLVAAVACGRLVVKDGSPLPVEKFFPEVFCPELPTGSVEISRFIARHQDPYLNIDLQKSLMAAGVGHVDSEKLGSMYAVVDPYFERGLKLMLRSAVRRSSDLKYIKEYNTENYAIEIVGSGVKSRLGKEAVERFTPLVDESIVYWNRFGEALYL